MEYTKTLSTLINQYKFEFILLIFLVYVIYIIIKNKNELDDYFEKIIKD